MCSWGSPHKGGKFYKGAPADTPWNKDLLWQKHVAKETTQMKYILGQLPETLNTKKQKRHAPRMKMGLTGTLIPDGTPRLASDRNIGTSTEAAPSLAEYTSRTSQSGRSSRRSTSSQSSASSYTSASSFSSSSTASSLRLAHIQREMEARTEAAERRASAEISQLRQVMQQERGRREVAEKRLNLLCSKLGIDEETT